MLTTEKIRDLVRSELIKKYSLLLSNNIAIEWGTNFLNQSISF